MKSSNEAFWLSIFSPTALISYTLVYSMILFRLMLCSLIDSYITSLTFSSISKSFRLLSCSRSFRKSRISFVDFLSVYSIFALFSHAILMNSLNSSTTSMFLALFFWVSIVIYLVKWALFFFYSGLASDVAPSIEESSSSVSSNFSSSGVLERLAYCRIGIWWCFRCETSNYYVWLR